MLDITGTDNKTKKRENTANTANGNHKTNKLALG